MIKIYKEYIRTENYFSTIFSYIILHLYNKDNFFKKRTNRNNLFGDLKKPFYLNKNKVIIQNNIIKKKNLVLHFSTSQISYFYYHYFVYILLPKLNYLNSSEKNEIIENVYLINNNTHQDVRDYIYNKINQNERNIIFCNNFLPGENFNYTNTLGIFLENKYFLDLPFKNFKSTHNVRKHTYLKKNRHNNCIMLKKQIFNLNKKNQKNVIYPNTLYISYFFNNDYDKQCIKLIKRNKHLNTLLKYNHIINEINKNIQWFKHYTFYKYYTNAYINFLNYRMDIFYQYMNIFVNKKKNIYIHTKGNNNGIIYYFTRYKHVFLNSNIFFHFINNQKVYLDFSTGADLYIKFLHLQEKIYNLSSIVNRDIFLLSSNYEDVNNKTNYNKPNLIKEIKRNINIHIWTNAQKEEFRYHLKKIKFKKFYN